MTDPTDIEFFLAHAPTGTPATELIKLAGLRWKIEENNAQSKDLLGLTRSPRSVRMIYLDPSTHSDRFHT
ncbi:hypothetical protein [Nonomuraea sp. B5E05]|uniref:hypothetical protein n=1 Tax=Nonomuraea sp. B5E05 TaxID=3153569 RepID=UPI0032608637